MKRLSLAVDLKLREEQAGFRRGRGCLDHTLKNIFEQCSEWQNGIRWTRFLLHGWTGLRWRLRLYAIPTNQHKSKRSRGDSISSQRKLVSTWAAKRPKFWRWTPPTVQHRLKTKTSGQTPSEKKFSTENVPMAAMFQVTAVRSEKV